jgi:hypothetical protein
MDAQAGPAPVVVTDQEGEQKHSCHGFARMFTDQKPKPF